ncbi:hypothetical protein PR048_002141 [Dryococelus australis]|uniref:Uncharacterized protein n=1 Tax=Dryococelus australis TaxID=614101 RepID=A0ABQ9IKG6_9NEOP|nr:hypothetical protein PR048_002141 [Dryococelus australis]
MRHHIQIFNQSNAPHTEIAIAGEFILALYRALEKKSLNECDTSPIIKLHPNDKFNPSSTWPLFHLHHVTFPVKLVTADEQDLNVQRCVPTVKEDNVITLHHYIS